MTLHIVMVTGGAQDAARSALGNEKMQAEGEVDQAEGKTQKNYGKVKDAVNDQTSH